MIVSRSRNFIFLRVPKTGSTSLHCKILDLLPYEEVDAHTPIKTLNGFDDQFNEKYTRFKLPKNPAQFKTGDNDHPNLLNLIEEQIISSKELYKFEVYGVMRNPIDRIVSASFHFAFDDMFFNKTTSKLDTATVVDHFLNFFESNLGILHRNQSYWLTHNNKPINNIYRYEEVDKCLSDILGTELNLDYKFRSRFKIQDCNKNIPKSLIRRIEELYVQDFNLWESLQPPADQS